MNRNSPYHIRFRSSILYYNKPKGYNRKNCNIHKGVTIGQENRGVRKGTPFIGNEVWIGINATTVRGIHIGSDVLIAPNTYVNCDIPDHSIVFGNSCIIKQNNALQKDISIIK